jgi:hypothetical protein
MPDLDDYFKGDHEEHDSHPLIRLLDERRKAQGFGTAKVQVDRDRAALGFEPARLSLLFFDEQDRIHDRKTEPWDPELNDALVRRGIRAVDETNEIQRFGLGLAAALQHPENRYGDGFYNSVLMLEVDRSPFAGMKPVEGVRPYITTNSPYEGGHAAEDCRVLIQAALQGRWNELTRQLLYDKTEAGRILAGALAYYLDERFSVSDGRKLGWLTVK